MCVAVCFSNYTDKHQLYSYTTAPQYAAPSASDLIQPSSGLIQLSGAVSLTLTAVSVTGLIALRNALLLALGIAQIAARPTIDIVGVHTALFQLRYGPMVLLIHLASYNSQLLWCFYRLVESSMPIF
jgi:hypothetical protein